MAFTYFFRDGYTLQMAAAILAQDASGRSTVRIWDAGCASGEEPYTLAVILAESMGYHAFNNVHILATDIDISNRFRERVTEGVFPGELLHRVNKSLKEKHFRPLPGGTSLQANRRIRNRITFQKHDLEDLTPPESDFSLVLCKNVLLHFKESRRIEIIRMFYNALLPGGLLVLEQTQRLPEETDSLFERLTSNARIYRKNKREDCRAAITDYRSLR